MRSSLERLSVPLFNVKGKRGRWLRRECDCAQENRQRTMGSSFLPIHAVCLSLQKDWSGLTPVKYKSIVPSRSYQAQHGLDGIFYTSVLTVVLLYFYFLALMLVLLFLVCSQFWMTLFYLAGPGGQVLPGPYGTWNRLGWEASETLLGKGNEMRRFSYGPSFSLRAGLSPSIMRFVF